jgi:RNA ligase
MKLEIKKGSENYCCTVVKIDNLHTIENADFIQRTVVYGNNVIIGKDIKEGDVMLYIPAMCRLNLDFCKYNNLFNDSTLNNDTTIKGHISKTGRTKAIKLRGIISDGLLLPITSLYYFTKTSNIIDFKVGDTFTDVDGISICEKYVVTLPRNGNPGGHKPAVNKFNRLVDNQFYLHNDTENLRRNIRKINPNDIIGIHYKKHGTSAVFANIPTKRPLKWYEKLLQRLGVKIDDIVYDIIYSSRNVIKNKYINTETGEGFYGEDVWGEVKNEIKDLIPKNWTIYGEILGFTPKGASIQNKYDYGCAPLGIQNSEVVKPQHKFYVYKISIVNPDGKVIYLTDKQIEEYCEKVGLLYKDTFIYYGTVKDYMLNEMYSTEMEGWKEKFLEFLEEDYNEKDCYMCTNKVPEEGIVVRIEKLESYEAYKLKSKRFVLMESEAQEKEEINIEDEDI